jgi:hypothetical protein
MVRGLCGSVCGRCGDCEGQAQEEREKRATHLSSVIGFGRGMQYNSWRIHKRTPIE